jgi:TetR/AcrR family transcriptional regulator, cholesterol catabolism regulator
MEQTERILLKATEMYMRFGIRSVTLDEIATQCGISKKTIYQYFEDKDALVNAVMTAMINRTECNCLADQSKSKNAIQEVFLALDMVQEMFATMNPTILYDLEKYHPKAFQMLEKHKNEFFYIIIQNNIEKGKTEGLYRPEINAEIITKLRIETSFLPFDQDIYPKSKFTIQQLEQEITEHFIYGIASLKGQKLIQKYKQERLKNQHI